MESTQPQVLQIPISKIHPSPNNPRHVITPEMLENLSISMKEAGLKNPVKLQRLNAVVSNCVDSLRPV